MRCPNCNHAIPQELIYKATAEHMKQTGTRYSFDSEAAKIAQRKGVEARRRNKAARLAQQGQADTGKEI